MEEANYHDSDEISLKWKVRYEEPLNEALSKQLDPLFANPNRGTWAEARRLLAHETESAVSKLLADISRLQLYPQKSNKMVQDLRDYGRNVVERKAREEAGKVQQRMKVRFASILSDVLVRRKVKKTTTKAACVECLKLLSVLVAIRLDDKPVKIESKFFSCFCEKKLDIREIQDRIIEEMLISSLIHKKSSSKKTLDSSTWPEISPEDTLIKPAECKVLWEYFQAEILQQTQAFVTGQAAGRAHSTHLDLGSACGGS